MNTSQNEVVSPDDERRSEDESVPPGPEPDSGGEQRDSGAGGDTAPEPRRGLCGACWLVMPALVSCLGHMISVTMLLSKWTAFEKVSPGGVFNFTSLICYDATMQLANAEGPSWYAVVAPSWISDAFVTCLALFMVVTGSGISRNLRILHMNSIGQTMLCAGFQLLLVWRFMGEDLPWWVIFSPWYVAMGLQIVLHSRKMPDRRGRRPGFPVGVPHVLALVVSFKLENAFNYATSSWANVLWPLWGAAGFFMLSLLFGVCCGLPLVLRREAQVRCHLICTFGSLLLLVSSVVFPALLAAVRLTLWLDGSEAITADSILVPYLIAVSIVVMLLCVSLVILSFSASLRARGFGSDMNSEDSEEAGGMAELFSAMPPPSALVRESSTLFRRVSSATMDKYERRHGSEPSANDIEIDDNDGLLASHRAQSDECAGDGDSAIELIEVRVEPRHQAAAPIAAPSVTADSFGALPVGQRAADVDRTYTGGPSDGGAAGSAALSVGPAGQDAVEGGSGDNQTDCVGVATGAANAEGAGKRGTAALDADEEGTHCWICFSGERDAVLLECGHGGICFECAQRCARRRPRVCPMCRQPITSIVRLAGTAEEVDGEVVVQVDTPAQPPKP